MSIIPNKYLATNLNRMEAGPGTLLRGNNVRIDGGRLRQRRGQDLLIPQDPLGISTLSGYVNYRCRKLFYYNGHVWGYFRDTTGVQADAIGYFDRDIGAVGQWIISNLQEYSGTVTGFNIDNSQIPPQIQQVNNRLLLATTQGVFASPKLEDDQLSGLQSIQTKMRPCGAPQAVPFNYMALKDTAATYNANWLGLTQAVSYRYVWKYTDANGAVSYGGVSDSRRITNTAVGLRAVEMYIAFPLEIYDSSDISRFSCQIYRTLSTLPSINGVAVDPGDQMFLVSQIRPTAAQVVTGYMYFIDIIDPAALQGPLHTNQTQQGAASSRIRPPICRTMAQFAGAAWFGNITDRWNVPFQLGGVVDLAAVTPRGLANNDIVILGDRCFQMKSGVINIIGNQVSLDGTAGYTNQFTRIRNTIHNLAAALNTDYTRDYYNLQTLSGPDDICGMMALQQVGNGVVPSTVTPYVGLYRAGGWPANMADNPSPISPTPLATESKGKGYKIIRIQGSGATLTFTLDSAPDFVAGDTVNLARPKKFYDDSLADNGTTGDICYYTPGQYVVTNVTGSTVQLSGVDNVATVDQNIGTNSGIWQYATVWTNLGAMHCVIDSVTLLKSPASAQQKRSKNRVMYSPYYEPESAPALNYFDIGASDKKVIKLIRLNKSLFAFKQDGLFRISGIYPEFVLQQFDPDIILLGPDLVCSMSGALYALTAKGVYQISENGAKRISYQIQNQIEKIAWSNAYAVQKLGFSVGHEQDHSVTFWLPSTPGPEPTCDVAFTYDGQGWTKRTDQANGACCGLKIQAGVKGNYLLYTMKNAGSGWLTEQRKDLNGYDLCDQKIPVTGIAISDQTHVQLTTTNDAGTVTAAMMLLGACLVVNSEVAKRAFVTQVVDNGGGVFTVTLQFNDSQYTSFSWSGSTGDLYMPIYSQWQYGIQGADQIQNRKHYSQVGLVFQQPYFSKADIGFSSDVDPSQTWLTSNLKGFTLYRADPSTWPLMQQDTTLADKTIRAIVSTGKARCSQLRVSVRHQRAMQFISVYGYFIKHNVGGKNIERNNV